MSDMPSRAAMETPGVTSSRPRTAYEAKIERVFEHNAETRSFFLRLPERQCLIFKPGQFLSLLLPVGDEVLTRPYSIASNPEEGNLLEICLNLVPGGRGSQYLFERTNGEVVRFTGPWGTFVLDQPPQAECIFLADRTAIAPIRPMIWRALMSRFGSPLRLLYSACKETELLYHEELEAWAQEYPRFIFESLLSSPSADWTGLPGPLLAEYVKERYVEADQDRSRHFYICGVGQQVISLRDMLRQAGYQRRAVQYEKW